MASPIGFGGISAAEASSLFGPDTATRRFRKVEARSHGFGGGRDAMVDELDGALTWVELLAHP